jgi:mono/diheme cytochrome c family protein
MRGAAIFFLLLILALAIFWGARNIPRKSPLTDHAHVVENGLPKAAPKKSISQPGVETNPPAGFYVGKGGQRVYIDYGTPDPLLRPLIQSVMDSSSDPNAKGKEIFTRICAACHQRDGAGKDGVAPPLVGSEWVLAPQGGRMVRIVLDGLNGPIQVRGRNWNLAMPPWRENLDDDQVAVVLSYIRSKLGNNHASAITPEFVAAARKIVHAKPETAQELLRVSDL